MGRTLEQLVDLQTKEDLRARLLTSMQGIGFVKKDVDATGSGDIEADGVAAAAYDIRIKISTSGELGTGAFQYSLDDGSTYAAAVTIPSSGIYVIPNTGVTLTFLVGPTGSGTSFVALDEYWFSTSVPTFPTASWQAGSTPLTLIELDAEAMETYSLTQQRVAQGGFLLTSKGDWLDLWLESMYDLPRRQAVTTVGNVVLTDAANSGPHTISVGQLWVATAGGLRYINVTGGTLPLGGTLTLSFRAEQPGSVYNVSANSITVLLTSLPGVTVSNPNPIGGSWITTSGSDKETDAQAIVRAQDRWPELGIGTPKDAYDLWAKTAAPSVTRTYVRASPTVPGQIDVFLASQSGTVDGSVVTAVQNYVNPRAALTSVPVVASAAAGAYTVQGTVYVTAGMQVQAAADISQNLIALNGGGTNTIAEELPGVPISGGTLYLTQIIEQIQLGRGVRNVVLTLPAADVVFAAGTVGVLTISLTYVEV
jgi:hypothetical protein